jgi:hypothetical protein
LPAGPFCRCRARGSRSRTPKAPRSGRTSSTARDTATPPPPHPGRSTGHRSSRQQARPACPRCIAPLVALPVAIPVQTAPPGPLPVGSGSSSSPESRMATTTRPTTGSRSTRARGLGAPRGGRARSAVGRRSSFRTSPSSPDAPAQALSRYRRKVSNHLLVACDDPAGWRRGARMNLRALAAADLDTPERQRNCGAVPVGDRVEIR